MLKTEIFKIFQACYKIRISQTQNHFFIFPFLFPLFFLIFSLFSLELSSQPNTPLPLTPPSITRKHHVNTSLNYRQPLLLENTQFLVRFLSHVVASPRGQLSLSLDQVQASPPSCACKAIEVFTIAVWGDFGHHLLHLVE